MTLNISIETAKRNAALTAAKHIKNDSTIGIGSGSTVEYLIEAIGQRIQSEELTIKCIPTSYQTFLLSVRHGIPVTTLCHHPTLDLTIDGADQIDPQLNLIKGMGGALTREKIVALNSKILIIISDKRKKVKCLGEQNHPVPIEVLPFALEPVMRSVENLGGHSTIRSGNGKVGPVITDNGNFIIDVNFGLIENPSLLASKLKNISGVIENGLFTGLTDIAYIGNCSRTEKLQRASLK